MNRHAYPIHTEKNKFNYNENIEFPKDVKHLLKSVRFLDEHRGNANLNLKKIRQIDNTSILFLTANIDSARQGKKLIKKKQFAPKKSINDRLSQIGFWNALCINPPKASVNLDFLRIRNISETSRTDNDFHLEIVNAFFTNKRYLDVYHFKDALFDAIFEAQANSVEHAFIGYDKEESKKVWLLGAYDKKAEELEFVYYDTGIGIFRSIDFENNKLTKILKRFMRRFGKNEVLKKLCNSNLSRHKNENKARRGQGMITFKAFIDNISNHREAVLDVITGNAMYTSATDDVKMIKGGIQGTLIRWRIGRKK